MHFVMQRNRVVGGTTGHFVSFKKGEPVFVPREMWSDVQAAGAVPTEELPVEETAEVKVLNDPQERQDAFFSAFKQLMDRNERGDFTASGLPNSKTLERVLGFQVVNKERDDMWQKFQAARRDEDQDQG